MGPRVGIRYDRHCITLDTERSKTDNPPGSIRFAIADGCAILTSRFIKEEDQWVGDCEILGVAHYGDILDEVRSGLKELLALTLNTMESVGERERSFAEHGITLHPS